MVLTSKLGPRASTHVMQRFALGNPTLGEVERALRELYAPPVSEEASRAEFHGRRQKPGESLVEFHAALAQLVRKAHPSLTTVEQQNYVLARVLAGMKNRDAAKHFVLRQPSHFDEIYRVAQAYHRFDSDTQGRPPAPFTSRQRPWTTEGPTAARAPERQRPWNTEAPSARAVPERRPWNAAPLEIQPPTGGPQRYPPRGACYNCGQTGHLRSTCPNLNA